MASGEGLTDQDLKEIFEKKFTAGNDEDNSDNQN
jgi:hypothetical protein